MGSRPRLISASRGAAILGLSKWKSQVEVWRDILFEINPDEAKKRGYQEPEPVDNPAVRWGLASEDMLVRLAEKLTGEKITDRERFYEDDSGKITCHVDGQFSDQKLHEGKTTSEMAFRASWGEPGTDRVPVEYQVQAQHQMFCSGATEVILTVAVFPKPPAEYETMGIEFDESVWEPWLLATGAVRQYRIERNSELISYMIAQYHDFVKNHLEALVEPKIRSFDDLKVLIPWPRGELQATERLEEITSEHASIADELASLKARQDAIKTEIGRFIQEGIERKAVADADRIEIYGRMARRIATFSKTKSGTMLRLARNKSMEGF